MGEVGVARADRCGCAGISNGVDGDFAGDFAGLVSAHAVSHNEQPIAGVPTVLVLLANLTGVGGERGG